MAFALALAGCAMPSPPGGGGPIRAAVIPPRGFIYTHFYAPLVLPGVADLGDVKPAEPGPAIYVRIPVPNAPLPLDFALGRVDIERAARRVGIERLVYADYDFQTIFG